MIPKVHIMNKKWAIPLAVVLVALFILFVGYLNDNPNVITHSGETKTFNVSSGFFELSEYVNYIKTKPYYEGCDEETVKWMKSLENKRVFCGSDSIVIMDISDAEKIPPCQDVTDAYMYTHFTGEVVENHSLGNNYSTVYYVKNVKFSRHEIIGNGLA